MVVAEASLASVDSVVLGLEEEEEDLVEAASLARRASFAASFSALEGRMAGRRE